MKKIHLFVGVFSFLIGIIIYITIYMYDSDDERICLNKKLGFKCAALMCTRQGKKHGGRE